MFIIFQITLNARYFRNILDIHLNIHSNAQLLKLVISFIFAIRESLDLTNWREIC